MLRVIFLNRQHNRGERSGRRVINAAVGAVGVEVQDEKGNGLPGYGLDDCLEMFADEIEGLVRWNDGSGVSSLAGKPVRLRSGLNDADVYAFRFR